MITWTPLRRCPLLDYGEKMKIYIEIGGIAIEIHHRYEYIKRLCEDYITEKAPAFSVSVTEDEIDTEVEYTNNRFQKRYVKAPVYTGK